MNPFVDVVAFCEFRLFSEVGEITESIEYLTNKLRESENALQHLLRTKATLEQVNAKPSFVRPFSFMLRLRSFVRTYSSQLNEVSTRISLPSFSELRWICDVSMKECHFKTFPL